VSPRDVLRVALAADPLSHNQFDLIVRKRDGSPYVASKVPIAVHERDIDAVLKQIADLLQLIALDQVSCILERLCYSA
jgi:hypothetical protein